MHILTWKRENFSEPHTSTKNYRQALREEELAPSGGEPLIDCSSEWSALKPFTDHNKNVLSSSNINIL